MLNKAIFSICLKFRGLKLSWFFADQDAEIFIYISAATLGSSYQQAFYFFLWKQVLKRWIYCKILANPVMQRSTVISADNCNLPLNTVSPSFFVQESYTLNKMPKRFGIDDSTYIWLEFRKGALE